MAGLAGDATMDAHVDARVPTSRGQIFFALLWLVTTTMLVLILQTVGVPQALGDDALGGDTGAASDFSLDGIDAVDDRYPSTVYAGMVWSVTDAQTIDSNDFLGRGSIQVDARLTNSLTQTTLRVPDSMVSLSTRTGDHLADGHFVDAGARLSLDPGESIDVTIAFSVGSPTPPALNSLVLHIAEPNRVPATILLDGPQPQPDYPIFAAVDTTPATLADPDDGSRQVVIEPSAASIGVDAGPERAAVGERLAVMRVVVQRAEADDEAGYLDTDFWALSTGDGATVAPVLVARTSQPASNADEVTLVFAYDGAADSLALVAGGDASFAIVLPS